MKRSILAALVVVLVSGPQKSGTKPGYLVQVYLNARYILANMLQEICENRVVSLLIRVNLRQPLGGFRDIYPV